MSYSAPTEGHHNVDRDPDLEIHVDPVQSSEVTFSLFYFGFCRILGLFVSCRRTDRERGVEIMVLRHQVHVLERQIHARVRYLPADRAIHAALSRLLPLLRWRSFLVTPDTLLRCEGHQNVHRAPGRLIAAPYS